uniref:Uncharacterized protein n=1 Tax=Sander lucioperca TaxID=283035 RepID=A0A8D0A1M4_SANLU
MTPSCDFITYCQHSCKYRKHSCVCVVKLVMFSVVSICMCFPYLQCVELSGPPNKILI